MQRFIIISFIVCTTFSYNSKISIADDSYRLPNNVRPLRYTITMEPVLHENVRERKFTGSVLIELKVMEHSRNITIHAKNLDINENSITIKSSNGIIIRHSNTTIDKMRDFYVISLESTIYKNESYNLSIGEFFGDLNFNRLGFHLAKYNDKSGKERLLALTDFQPSAARTAFPCFDEPALKASFVIIIIRNGNYTSVSNEELLSIMDLGSNRFMDTYKPTVNMSTYLVAFAVSDYKHSVQNGRFRIFAKPEAIDSGKANYGLSFSENVLTALEEFTSINYTLSKLDLFGVPEDYFATEAMENWGLITYKEPVLLCSNTSIINTKSCITLIAHELVHQWFGNLVTPIWWKYLWLSEGLATYLEYYITSTIKPSWELMDQFIIIIQQRVLDMDGNIVKQPLNYDPPIPGDIPSPVIAYYKGACLIRMARHFLTHDVFKAGLRMYLKKHQFGAVEPSNLYDAFQEAINEANANTLLGNLTVPEVMKSWDSRNGYPVLNIVRDYDNGSTTFSQKKFFRNDIFKFQGLWYIPINVIFHVNTDRDYYNTTADFWLTERTITIANTPKESWILVNKLQTGYYRVNYDLTNWQRLTTFLNTESFEEIHFLNRAQLIDDAFALAKWNYIPFNIPLDLSLYLIRERNYIPFAAFLNLMKSLNVLMSASQNYKQFQDYMTLSLSTVSGYLGYEEKENDTHLDKLNRIDVLKWLCYLGHPKCRNTGLTKLREWLYQNVTSVTSDLQTILFCGGIKAGTENDLNDLYKQYQKSTDQDQKNRLLISLGCSENSTMLYSLLDDIFNTSNALSTHERKSVFANIVQSGDQGLEVAAYYVTEHLLDLNEIFSKTNVARLLGEHITSSDFIMYMYKIRNPRLDVGRIISTCIYYARKNIDLLAKGYIEQISKWLIQKYNVSPSI